MISWNDSFSVTHKGIDEQHKKLISIIEEIVFLLRNKDNGLSNLIEVVTELDNYVDVHFKYEEALMKMHSYPNTFEHIVQHNELRAKIAELNIFNVNNTAEFYDDMLKYLVDWLSRHIMQTDKKLGLFLSQAS